MCRIALFSVLLAATSLRSAAAEPPVAELLNLHVKEAEAYRIYRDEDRKQELELRTKPVFTWTNLVGEHTQQGHLFVWMQSGRPEAIGTIFSARTSDPSKRMIVHEFHSLSTRRLFPVTPETSTYQWRPEEGIALLPLESAPTVADSSGRRLVQMRTLARSFAAESRTAEGKKWELRLLPTPLYEYEPEKGNVLQGALFAMVSSAGTDPELLLLIEARRAEKNKPWVWHGAALRFSDKDLIVKRGDQPLWSSLDSEQHRVQIKNDYTLLENPDKTYTCYRSRIIDELPDAPP